MNTEIVVAIITACGAIILSLVNMIVSTLLNNRKKRKEELNEQTDVIFKRLNLLELSTQAILRDRLYAEHSKLMRRGRATYDEKNNFENMYKNYHTLGSNGVMDVIRKEVEYLPTKESKIYSKNQKGK